MKRIYTVTKSDIDNRRLNASIGEKAKYALIHVSPFGIPANLALHNCAFDRKGLFTFAKSWGFAVFTLHDFNDENPLDNAQKVA